MGAKGGGKVFRENTLSPITKEAAEQKKGKTSPVKRAARKKKFEAEIKGDSPAPGEGRGKKRRQELIRN